MFDAACFPLNPNPTVQYREIGTEKHKVIVVDDFYVDPERVAALVEQVEFRIDPAIVQMFPGDRAEVEADTRHLARAVWNYYGRTSEPRPSIIPLSISRFRGGCQLGPRQRLPHIDPTLTAFVYLNRPVDCSGGTALYRHRGSGFELIPLRPENDVLRLAQQMGYRLADFEQMGYPAIVERLFFNERFAPEGNRVLNEGNHVWELMTLVEMRFNRLVIYDGRIPHGMWLDADSFLDTPRIHQLLSLSLDDGQGSGGEATAA